MTRSAFLLSVVAALGLLAGARAADGKVLQLTSRSVDLSGKLTLELAGKAADKIVELDSISGDPIFLRVNAFGDSVEAAFALVDTIASVRSPVHAVVQSRAYEMGAVVAVSCARTYVYPHAVLMLGPNDKVSTEMKPAKEPAPAFLEGYVKRLDATVAERIGMEPADYAARVKEGWWLTAEEAVKAHVADEIVESLAYRELFIETTEIKKTVTATEEKHFPMVRPADAETKPRPVEEKRRVRR